MWRPSIGLVRCLNVRVATHSVSIARPTLLIQIENVTWFLSAVYSRLQHSALVSQISAYGSRRHWPFYEASTYGDLLRLPQGLELLVYDAGAACTPFVELVRQSEAQLAYSQLQLIEWYATVQLNRRRKCGESCQLTIRRRVIDIQHISLRGWPGLSSAMSASFTLEMGATD